MSRQSYLGGRWVKRFKKGSWHRILVVLAVVAVGVIVLVSTHAASPAAQIESELGNRSTNASQINSANASSGKAVRFNAPVETANGKFYIVGKDIVDPDGNKFLPMGANVAVRQAPYLEHGYVFNYFGTANGHSQDVQNWGWNTIRVNTGCSSTSSPSLVETLSGLNELITEYTSKKMVVLVDCHISVGPDHTIGDSEVQAVLPLIRAVAQTYKDNPYVWINTVNEPTYTDGPWVTIQEALYNEVRTRAPNMVFVGDLPGFGNKIESLVDSSLATAFGTSKCNVVYGWHAYGFINGYANDATHQSYINQLAAKKIAMVVGELGDPLKNDGSPLTAADPTVPGVAGNPDQNRIGANAAIKYGPGAGYGLLWWHATGDSNNSIVYSLTKDKTSPWTVTSANAASKLSPTGKAFWDVSHTNHNLGKFTGNLADSHCAL